MSLTRDNLPILENNADLKVSMSLSLSLENGNYATNVFELKTIFHRASMGIENDMSAEVIKIFDQVPQLQRMRLKSIK